MEILSSVFLSEPGLEASDHFGNAAILDPLRSKNTSPGSNPLSRRLADNIDDGSGIRSGSPLVAFPGGHHDRHLASSTESRRPSPIVLFNPFGRNCDRIGSTVDLLVAVATNRRHPFQTNIDRADRWISFETM
ncbi:hypothetical protein WN55_00273 [Dufourea novaeangliae]|uniref:Uncharacterized protein n=1 Tax=Dufourea novaeangliae TaxID=178035 RepID=A0A154PCQ6_DUFNO|nr:hypothetical protein WN55_00273 [Dufourea novaeangliae]